MRHLRQLRAYAGAPLPLPLQRVAERVWADEDHVARVPLSISHRRETPPVRAVANQRVTVELGAALVHRWPALDDPWRPEHAALLTSEAEAIEAFLAASPHAARRAELDAERAPIADAHDGALVRLATIERLQRAHATLRLAARLRATGDRFWLRYQSLLACERGLP